VPRRLGYLALFVAACATVASRVVGGLDLGTVDGFAVARLVSTLLLALAVVCGTYGAYVLVSRWLSSYTDSKRRQHDLRNVVRLGFTVVGLVALAGVVTEQWLGVLFSLGVVGFGVTFALQQPLFSLIGWAYIMTKRPYQVGDRVAIDDSKGDVVEVDFLVTTLWEVEGDLVSTHQPSGRVVTLPNSVVLSSHVYNYTRSEFPYVWNELKVEVAYETDLAFARETMQSVADDYLGDEMERNVERYREELAETPVDLDINARPTVNVTQQASWMELRLRYLADPRRMQPTRNELYERVLAALNEHPDRVQYPIGRTR
jgi:small-conductance mechanosensitive channel